MNMKNLKNINKKGFTLAEVVTAVGILVIIVGFTGVIFKSGIDAYRQSGANAEILQKLRTITTQLDRDFSHLRKDGWLEIMYFPLKNRKETDKSTNKINVRMDSIYYFTTGDFQSWYDAGIRNNVARIFVGHDSSSVFDPNDLSLNKCRLARDVLILTPETLKLWDNAKLSFASFAQDPNAYENLGNLFVNSVPKVSPDPYRIVRTIMCENVGQLMIQWTRGERNADNTILWSSATRLQSDWPKALKFTFTIYDSKEIIKGGQTFTHIVYLEN